MRNVHKSPSHAIRMLGQTVLSVSHCPYLIEGIKVALIVEGVL